MDDYIERNRAAWAGFAEDYVAPGREAWAASEPYWGIWRLPERDLRLLPDDLGGKRCLEIGCGAAYVSAWLARRGGDVVGIDPTPNQLATAQTLRAEHGLAVALVEAVGERLPFRDATFDFAISEYGAALWADPYAWVPEAARVLKPGARLVFLTNAALSALCMGETDDEPMSATLRRPYLGMHRIEWRDSPEVEFNLPHGEWIRLLRSSGFEIERLLELGAPPGAKSRYAWADASWAQSWPTEEAWCVRRFDRRRRTV